MARKTRARAKAKRGLESLLLKALREGRRAYKKEPVKTNWKLMRSMERELLKQKEHRIGSNRGSLKPW